MIIDVILTLGSYILSAFIGWMICFGARSTDKDLDEMWAGHSASKITKDCAKMFMKDISKFVKNLRWSKR